MAGNLRSWLRNWFPRFDEEQQRRLSRWGSRLMLEVLEDRYLLSAYVVTSTADSGAGTLRDAITQVNAGSYNEIDFAIGASGSAQTITPLSALPTITANGVYINGLSQGGSGNTSPLVELSGASAGTIGIDGLLLQGSNCTVSGLMIEAFSANGIEITGNNNTIGTLNDINTVISGNAQDGVRIDSGATGNLLQFCFIGTDATGDNAVGNSNGVEILGSNNTVGALGYGGNNFISGNSNDGVLFDSGSTGNLVS